VSTSIAGAIIQLRNWPAFLAIGCGVAFIIGSSGFTPTGYFLPRMMSTMIIGLASLQIFFHIKNRNAERVDIMDLGMHSLAIPGSKQAAAFIATGLVGFMILAGIIGLRWAALVLAMYLPATLMANGKWRILGPVIAASLVFAFAFGMPDNLLNPIWPEAGLFDWLGRQF